MASTRVSSEEIFAMRNTGRANRLLCTIVLLSLMLINIKKARH